MRKKIIRLSMAAALLAALPALAQKPLPFEERLLHFQYGILKDLSGLTYEQIREFPFMKLEHPVNEKCREFYSAHEAEIREYRTEQLRRYQNISLSTGDVSFRANAGGSGKECDVLSAFAAEMSRGSASSSEYIEKSYTLRLMFINPLMEMQMVMNNHLAVEKGAAEFAAHNLRMYIGRGLVKSEMIDGNNWKITVDEYADVFVFRYNVETGVLCLLETGTRAVRAPDGREKTAPAK
jgi:hypothetical protein